MDTAQDVIDWLRQLHANALSVHNRELAANCEKARAVVEQLTKELNDPRRHWPSMAPISFDGEVRWPKT